MTYQTFSGNLVSTLYTSSRPSFACHYSLLRLFPLCAWDSAQHDHQCAGFLFFLRNANKLSSWNLKQHCVTLTATRGAKLNGACWYVTQNSCFSKTGSYFMEKTSSGFPSDVLQLLCLPADFSFTEAVPNNNPLLLLQLQSAGSLHAAFRNLWESQSWGRAVEGHQRENQRTFSL